MVVFRWGVIHGIVMNEQGERVNESASPLHMSYPAIRTSSLLNEHCVLLALCVPCASVDGCDERLRIEMIKSQKR